MRLCPKKHHILEFRHGWAIFDYQDFCFYSSFCLSPFAETFFPAVRRYLTSHRTEPFVYEGNEEPVGFRIFLTPGVCYAYRYSATIDDLLKLEDVLSTGNNDTRKEKNELILSEWRYSCDDLAVLAQLLDDVEFYQRDLAREDLISSCLYKATEHVAPKEERQARCRYIAAEVAALRQLLHWERTSAASEGESASNL